MSFSSKVKGELSRRMGGGRHCQLAELAALSAFGGPYAESEDGPALNKRSALLKSLFGMEEIKGEEDERRVYSALKMWRDGGARYGGAIDGMLVQQDCCKRAFVRGAFLAAGSISDPNKSYHFEIVCRSDGQAAQLRDVIRHFDLDAKVVARKKHQVVYLKEGAQIVDALSLMEAYVALMDLENVRIRKDVRNAVNRKVNCETANITKTVSAAVRQAEDIALIRDKAGLFSLPDGLREVAELRLEYPDAPLAELGTYLSPPVGKSGVNHRLRKISEIADRLRE